MDCSRKRAGKDHDYACDSRPKKTLNRNKLSRWVEVDCSVLGSHGHMAVGRPVLVGSMFLGRSWWGTGAKVPQSQNAIDIPRR